MFHCIILTGNVSFQLILKIRIQQYAKMFKMYQMYK